MGWEFKASSYHIMESEGDVLALGMNSVLDRARGKILYARKTGEESGIGISVSWP